MTGGNESFACPNITNGEWVMAYAMGDLAHPTFNYDWSASAMGAQNQSQSGSTPSFGFNLNSTAGSDVQYNLCVHVTNACGASPSGQHCCSGTMFWTGGGGQFSVSPNPADGELAIAVDEVSNQPQAIAVDQAKAKDVQRTYQIFNTGGRLMRSGTMAGARDNVSLSGLPTGTYHLVLLENGKMVGRKTFVKQ